MSHPNLSARLNALVDYQLLYKDLALGERLVLYATDARSNQPDVLALQVVGWRVSGDDRCPVFRISNGSHLMLFGDDRATPIRLKRGTLMLGGIAATHIPQFVLSMIGFGSIGLGRDYSFEYVGGGNVFAYIHQLSRITRAPRPKRWVEPADMVLAYLAAVARNEEEYRFTQARRDVRLTQALTVFTANSVYELTAIDAEGKRTLTKRGTGILNEGRLVSLHKGHGMDFDVFNLGKTISTSVVERIEPNPDVVG